MKWLDIQNSGMTLSIQTPGTGKQRFYLQIIDRVIAEPHLDDLKESGFAFMDGSARILSASLTYRARNALMSIKESSLFTTTLEEIHDNPYDGYRPVRSTGTQTHGGASTENTGSQEASGNPEDIHSERRPGDTEPDKPNIPSDSPSKPDISEGNVSATGATEQLGDVHGDKPSIKGDGVTHSGSGIEGSGGIESGGSGIDVEPGNGQPERRGENESLPADREHIKKNPNHYFITDEITREGGFAEKQRVEENFAALHLLKTLEVEDRPATDDEKSELVKYNGWGGIKLYHHKQDYQNPENPNQLSRLLSEEEMDSVESSILNAHFTPPHAVKSLWDTLQNDLGFQGGKIHEPSLGVGNFFGLAPKEIVQKSDLSATELETVTGRIAKKIYPDADIQIKGFEELRLINNQLDLIISNIPFGKYKIHDPEYKKDHSIHNYFLIRSLDKLKPGGFGVFITSSYSMDSLNRDARREMHNRGHLLGAFRLPEKVMDAQANTVVTTDILIFQKRVKPRPISEPDPGWLDVYETPYQKSRWQDPEVFRTNRHFIDNPESLLGQMDVARRQYGRLVRTVVDDPGRPIEQLLQKALHARLSSESVQNLLDENRKALANKRKKPQTATALEPVALAHQKKSIDSYVKQDGKMYQIVNVDGEGHEVKGNAKVLAKLSAYIDIRETVNRLYDIQRKTEGDDPRYLEERDRLNQEYDLFIIKHGYLNHSANTKLFLPDPEAGRVLALEDYDQQEKKATKAEIFSQRVIGPPPKITSVDTSHDALTVCLDQHNRVDIDLIAQLCNKSPENVSRDLAKDIYLNPESQDWEIASIYLSGNVRKKLINAEIAAEVHPLFTTNVEALRKVIPPTIPAADIETRLGVPWVSVDLHKDFVVDLLQTGRSNVELHKRAVDSKWVVDIDHSQIAYSKLTMDFGTDRKNFTEILKNCLAQKIVKIYDQIEDGEGHKKRVYNHEATVAAQHKQEEIQQKFKEFIWAKDPARAEELEKLYNERHNAYVPPTFNGSHLTFPGMSSFMKPRSVQSDAIYRGMHGNTLINHEVGVGKTFEQIGIAMEWKRLGIARKPMMVIPKHTLDQINTEAIKIYPTANVLLARDEDFQKKNRRKFIGKVANNDWDLVIVGHTMYERILVDPQFEKDYLKEIKAQYKAELREIENATGDMTKTRRKKWGEKDIQTKIKNLETRIRKLGDGPKDDEIYLQQLGVDGLLIDEAHRYKNLMIVSGSSEVAGHIKGSKRAWDMFMKTQWLLEERGDNKGLIFATGTPVTNNPMEIYNMQRYLQMDTLVDQGIDQATEWYANFINPKVSWEPSHAARGWNLRVRPCLHNVPELISVFRNCMDVVTAEQAGIKRPEVIHESVVTPMSALQQEMMDDLDKMVKDGDEHIFTIMHRGRTMALDPRLLLEFTGDLPEDYKNPAQVREVFPFHSEDILDPPTSKINAVVENIFEQWDLNHGIKGTQLVFSDLGVPNKTRRFNVYDEIKEKLIAKGIPEEQIAFIHDYPKDEQKAVLFENVRQGNVRVLMGSTQKMGEGLNVQNRAVASHNVDAPYTPAGIEQRNGRTYRFGNQNKHVKIYNYTTQDTFDLFLWNLLKIKNEQFKQILSGTSNLRKFDFEIDPSFAETAALTSGNPLIKEKLEVEEKVVKLEALESQFQKEIQRARWLHDTTSQDIEGLSEYLVRVTALPDLPDTPLWKIKSSKFSEFDKDFENEDREKFYKAFRAFRNKVHITTFKDDTLSVSDIPLSSYLKRDDYDNKKMYTAWEVGGIRRGSLSYIEDLLRNRDDKIQHIQDKIDALSEEKQHLEGKITGMFELQDELVTAKVRLNEINHIIENEASESDGEVSVKNNSKESVSGEIASNMFNDTLDMLSQVSPSELAKQDEKGNTVAHYVVDVKRDPALLYELVQKNHLLLEIPNKAGETPIDWIRDRDIPGFQDFLDNQQTFSYSM